MNPEALTVNQALIGIIAILVFIFIIVLIKLRKYLFTNHRDNYPVKYYSNEKRKEKRKAESRKDKADDSRQYDGIINDYPTYFTQDGVKKSSSLK